MFGLFKKKEPASHIAADKTTTPMSPAMTLMMAQEIPMLDSKDRVRVYEILDDAPPRFRGSPPSSTPGTAPPRRSATSWICDTYHYLPKSNHQHTCVQTQNHHKPTHSERGNYHTYKAFLKPPATAGIPRLTCPFTVADAASSRSTSPFPTPSETSGNKHGRVTPG